MSDDDTLPEDWKPLIEELRLRVDQGRAMGGEAKLARRRQQGKWNARELVDGLVDPASFVEIGTLAGGVSHDGLPPAPADALVGGIARIDGRHVVVACEDFTVMGGSIGHATNAKKVRLATLALQERAPFISILEGAGERASNALGRYPYAPNDLQVLAELAGRVPTVALVVGSSAGHGALSGLMKDLVVFTQDACMFSAGPALVAEALGEVVTKEELGGAEMHAAVSGVCHNLADDAEHALRLIRHYLSFFPSSAWQVLERRLGAATEPRRLDEILRLVPRNDRRSYDMGTVIDLLVDDPHDELEVQPHFGRSIVTRLARLGGHAVGIVANQPAHLAGAITAQAADKAAHFINVCNAFHLPVVFLADNPGIMSGKDAERAGTLRAAARMYAAQARLTSPKLHVTLRKAFGFGSSLMAMNPFDAQTLTLAFPGISLGGMPASGGASAAKADAETREQLREIQQSSAWKTGDTLAYDEIIDPRDLRNSLIRGLEASEARVASLAGPVLTSCITP